MKTQENAVKVQITKMNFQLENQGIVFRGLQEMDRIKANMLEIAFQLEEEREEITAKQEAWRVPQSQARFIGK